MIKYFINENHKTVEIKEPKIGSWINISPPLKQEEFFELSNKLDIPLDFLTDSLDIDERSRFEEEDNVRLIVIKNTYRKQFIQRKRCLLHYHSDLHHSYA